MQDDGKTPETPQWVRKGRKVHGKGVEIVALTENDAALGVIILNHLEAALREAEAKAALADEALPMMRYLARLLSDNPSWPLNAGVWLSRYDAPKQPKAGA